MKSLAGLRLVVAAAIAVGASAAALAQTQPLKPWRLGIIEAKATPAFSSSPAGATAATSASSSTTSSSRGDTVALKALLAGDLDSYEGGTGERSRG